MKIVFENHNQNAKNLLEKVEAKIINKYPSARNLKISLSEENQYHTALMEIRIGKRKFISKKEGASLHEAVNRSYNALTKQMDKGLQKKKVFFSFPIQSIA